MLKKFHLWRIPPADNCEMSLRMGKKEMPRRDAPTNTSIFVIKDISFCILSP